MVRPGDRGARAQQDQGVDQRKIERVDDVDAIGRELDKGSRAILPDQVLPGALGNHLKRRGEQREIEESPEPPDEEHHLGKDEQDHAIAHVQLHHRGMIARLRFLDDLREPAPEGRDQQRDACAKDHFPSGHRVHEENHARGEGQRRKGTDERPDVGSENVIIVVLGASHFSSFLFSGSALNRAACRGPEGQLSSERLRWKV